MSSHYIFGYEEGITTTASIDRNNLRILTGFFKFFLNSSPAITLGFVKDYRVYTKSYVEKYEYVSVNGRVVDLSRAESPNLKAIYSKYKGKDISSLAPSFLILGRPRTTNSFWVYPDKDINTCVNDALIGDSWLMALMNVINGSKVLFNNGVLEKCANPVAGSLDENCITSGSDLREMYSLTIGALEVDENLFQASTRIMKNTMTAIDNRVFDVTAYLTFATFYNSVEESISGQLPSPRSGDTMFLPESVTLYFLKNMGISRSFSYFVKNTNVSNPSVFLNCFRKLFFVGKLKSGLLGDISPNDNWILLISSALASSFVFIKIISFLIYPLFIPSNLSPTSSSFIISVFLFNEPLSLIQRCLTRILSSNLPGGQSLLFVVCDGNVQSHGEIKETHRVVLDHLNHPWHQCPGEVIDFLSLGEGVKQKNRARIFFGTYTNSHGCHMPYIVLAKVGGLLEPHVSTPGTRGKRDSLYILLSFFSLILSSSASLSPIDNYLLETFLQIGFDPKLVEYLITIDGDMLVDPNAISQLIQQMTLETELAVCSASLRTENGFSSISTMLESFHIFWTKHVVRSFESLTFQTQVNTSIACYRIQQLDKSKTFTHHNFGKNQTHSTLSLWAAHPQVVSKFGLRYFTSIMAKNLYQLGEDSILASIVQEFQPKAKLRFFPSAISSVELPTSFLNLLFRLKREWIFRLFASISILYQRSTLLHRFITLCSLFWKLTSPIILCIGYTMLVLAIAPFVTIALFIWTGVIAIFFLGLVFFARFDIMFQFLLHLLIGLPLHMILVPILSFLEISNAKWADQWPMNNGVTNLQRSPGTKWDPILENIAESDKELSVFY
ncbi:hypothetical protein HMI54_001791 [Coelomomyces lativittatus]|nr:hypothetical protein HMI54_001791 [Coelomomyces lativittatus]KAJ1511128.1 hypothetical protein HMI55_006718 [Coelomomyces lativittatus]KAJ1514737.1 hypothetical protein HMI56_007560 [Coelomomyces lativittatus]